MEDFSTRLARPIQRVLDERDVDALRSFTVAECAKQAQAPGRILFVKKNLAAGMNDLREMSNRPARQRAEAVPFLGQDDRCTIYDVRPAVCREYPHVDKEGLVFRTMGVAHNTLICPAVFWVVESMNWWTLG